MAAVTSQREDLTMRALFGSLVLVTTLTLAMLAGPAAGQTAPAASLKERFNSADKNHDGKVDREEFYQAIVEGFYFRDKDKRGYLTIEQLREASPEAFK